MQFLLKLLTPIKSIGLSSKNVKAPPAGPKARMEYIRLRTKKERG